MFCGNDKKEVLIMNVTTYGKPTVRQRINNLIAKYNRSGYVMIPYTIPLKQYDRNHEEC